MSHGTLTYLLSLVQSVCGHGKHHVHHGKSGEEVQEVHKGQMRVLLEWHTVDKQGEGAPESPSAKVIHPYHQDQDDSPLKGN